MCVCDSLTLQRTGIADIVEIQIILPESIFVSIKKEAETIMPNIIPYLVKIIDPLNRRNSRIPSLLLGGGRRKENCRPTFDERSSVRDQIFAFGKIEQLYKRKLRRGRPPFVHQLSINRPSCGHEAWKKTTIDLALVK